MAERGGRAMKNAPVQTANEGVADTAHYIPKAKQETLFPELEPKPIVIQAMFGGGDYDK